MANKNYEYYLLEKILYETKFIKRLEDEGYSFFIAQNLQGKLSIKNNDLKKEEQEFLGLKHYYDHQEYLRLSYMYSHGDIQRTEAGVLAEKNKYAWKENSLMFIGLKHKDDAHSYRRLDISVEDCRNHLNNGKEICVNENLGRLMIQYLFEGEPSKLLPFIYKKSSFYEKISWDESSESSSIAFYDSLGFIKSKSAGLMGTKFFQDEVEKYNKIYKLKPFELTKAKSLTEGLNVVDQVSQKVVGKDYGVLSFQSVLDFYTGIPYNKSFNVGTLGIVEEMFHGEVLTLNSGEIYSVSPLSEESFKKIRNVVKRNIKSEIYCSDVIIDMDLLSGKNKTYLDSGDNDFVGKFLNFFRSESPTLKILLNSVESSNIKNLNNELVELSDFKKKNLLTELAQSRNLDINLLSNVQEKFNSGSASKDNYNLNALFYHYDENSRDFDFNKKSVAKMYVLSLVRPKTTSSHSMREKWGKIIKLGLFTEVVEQLDSFLKSHSMNLGETSIKSDILIISRAFGSIEYKNKMNAMWSEEPDFQLANQKFEKEFEITKKARYSLLGVRVDDLKLEDIDVEREIPNKTLRRILSLDKVYLDSLDVCQSVSIVGTPCEESRWGERDDEKFVPSYKSGVIHRSEKSMLKLPDYLKFYVPEGFDLEMVSKTLRHVLVTMIDDKCATGETVTDKEKIRLLYDVLSDQNAIRKALDSSLGSELSVTSQPSESSANVGVEKNKTEEVDRNFKL